MTRGASGTIAYSREVIVEDTAEAAASPAEEKVVYVKTYGTAAAVKPTSSRKGVTTY